MLHILGLLTAFIGISSGMAVLALGDWRYFKLKYAGVAISTAASIWFLIMFIIFGGDIALCNSSRLFCMTGDIYHTTRNIAFIIFHLAVGRDAITLKERDRRKSS